MAVMVARTIVENFAGLMTVKHERSERFYFLVYDNFCKCLS